jgi:hypothetical protein
LTFISLAAVLGKRARSADKLAPIHGWQLLDDNHLWKKFGGYWRKQNVETTRDSPRITLAYEERGKEDPDYRLRLAGNSQNRIIVRDCYKSLYDFIRKNKNGYNRGLILTGQPGTGAPSS